jgi:hypothetical protein
MSGFPLTKLAPTARRCRRSRKQPPLIELDGLLLAGCQHNSSMVSRRVIEQRKSFCRAAMRSGNVGRSRIGPITAVKR